MIDNIETLRKVSIENPTEKFRESTCLYEVLSAWVVEWPWQAYFLGSISLLNCSNNPYVNPSITFAKQLVNEIGLKSDVIS